MASPWNRPSPHTNKFYLNKFYTEDLLDRELIKILYSMLPVILIANVFNSTVLFVVFAQTVATSFLVTWWGLMVAIVVVRGLIWLRYRRQDLSSGQYVIAIVGSASVGVLWGMAGLVLYAPGNEAQRMVLGFILGGMGAGALIALTPCLPAFYGYLFPSIVPYGVRLAWEGDPDHLAMAAACGLYLAALTFLGRIANGWLKESVVRRFENAELVQSLERRVEERTAELNHANEQLHRDVAERRRAEAALARYADRQAAIAEFGRLALSEIDLNTLFARAAAVVRYRLEVAGAAVIQEPSDPRDGQLHAAIGLARWRSEAGLHLGLSDHPALIMDEDAGSGDSGVGSVDLARLQDPETTVQAIIAYHNRYYGTLVAVAAARHAYSANDITFLQSIANMLAAAMERKRIEQHIERLALQDPLTGLPNRTVFRNQLQQELEKVKRYRSIVAVLLIDLDNFKDVNDTLGHSAGDRLLVAVAQRLKTCLRNADASARLGGDEFALILPQLRSPEDAAVVAQKVAARIAEPLHLDNHEFHIGASIGITIGPGDGKDVDSLLRNADLALYRAKSDGRGTYRFYAADMTAHVEARKTLEKELRWALGHNQLFLHYQPIVDLTTRRPAGVEALLRWRHPLRGDLLPLDFIPIAEATGLIVPLGRWVLDRVAEQMLNWRRRGLPHTFIAINISPSQCRHGDLVSHIEDLSRRFGTYPDWLELEVTEQLFMPDGIGECGAILQRLKYFGVTVSIDDFGTGYSNLKRLRNLPVDKIKIDKAFIAQIGASSDADMIVRAIISLGKNLGMRVTAEGVENQAQLDFLVGEGCDSAQGYLLGAPLPEDAFDAMFTSDLTDQRPGNGRVG